MDKKTLKSKLNKFFVKIGESALYFDTYTGVNNYYNFPTKDISKYSTEDDNKGLF